MAWGEIRRDLQGADSIRERKWFWLEFETCKMDTNKLAKIIAEIRDDIDPAVLESISFMGL